MATKLLACISANNATVAVWKGGTLQDVRNFRDEEKGWRDFESYLRDHPRATVSIMADSIDEDYRMETLPHASGSDRSQLIARKLRQLFRTTPFAAASLQERMTGRRREDRYLFAAITRPELLSPWLRVINALEMPIDGIYLLPVVTLSIVDRLKIKRPNLLVVSKNEAGLRQTFTRRGGMRVSRLTPIQDDSARSSGFYAEEIINTRMYLDALTVTHVDDIVTVLILDHDDSLGDLPGAITRDRTNVECIRIQAAQLREDLGTPLEGADRTADVLHLFLLAGSRPAMNLVPATLKMRLQVHVLGRYMYYASAGVVALAVAWTLASSVEIMRSDGEVKRLVQEAQTYQARYQEVTREFPVSPASSDVLRETVDAAKSIETSRQTPQSMMLVLGRALNQMQNIGLNRFEWVQGKPESVASSSQRPDFTANSAGDTREFGIVSAQVLAYEGDHQSAFQNISAFAQLLSTDDRVAQVDVTRLPLDLDPNAGLSGSTSTRNAADTAPFEVILVLRQRPAAD